MSAFYTLGKAFCQFVRFQCVRAVVLHPERAEEAGGYVLACTHLSHLEPAVVATLVRRKIDWMSRIEFFKYRVLSAALYAMDAFPVNRQGVPVRAIRTAIERVRMGRIVGIFPEGGVTPWRDSVMRGGPIKKGACVVAYRAGAPVLPVVVLGCDKLNRVGPWLPFKRARVWLNYGKMIHPKLDEPRRRVARDLMAQELQAEYQALYRELCASCGIKDGEVA